MQKVERKLATSQDLFNIITSFFHLLLRGKKRKGLSTAYLIDDDVDNRWILMPTGMGSTTVPESEIQEVTVEIGDENPKPSGTAKLMVIVYCVLCIGHCIFLLGKDSY